MIQPDPDTNRSGEVHYDAGAVPRSAPSPKMSTELESCLAQVAEARREAEEFRNRYMRAAADVENARKQAERNAEARSVQDKRLFLREFLEVADSLERVLSQPGDLSALYEGVKLSLRQLQQILVRAGVERMEIKAGDTFDPMYHEAVEVRAGDTPHDMIVEVVRAGYLHEGAVLRPAQVIVARGRQ
jgi:molecular chaperone GrpE